jgi:hypothetical protein
LSDVTTLVPGYGSTTSDHYPVFTRFAFDAAILPVSLVALEGNQKSAKVVVNWASEKEINSKSYTIEKSTDGKDFKVIGTVAAAGTSNSRLQYSFTDNTPVNGSNYYRLKIADKDATFSYSRIIEVRFGSHYQFTLSPNPATSTLEMRFQGGGNGPAMIRLTNLNGKAVREQTEKFNGAGRIKMDVGPLPRGVYILSIQHNGLKQTRKIVLQ